MLIGIFTWQRNGFDAQFIQVNSVAADVITDSSVTFTVFICIYEYLIWPLSAANAKRNKKREEKNAIK